MQYEYEAKQVRGVFFYSICKRNLLTSVSSPETSKKCSDCCWLINTVNEMLINHQQFSLTITWIDHID